MRLNKRGLAFLLTCSLLIIGSRAQAGNLRDQPFVDRVLFLQYLAQICYLSLSNTLQSYVMGDSTLPTQEELDEIEKYWKDRQEVSIPFPELSFPEFQADNPRLALLLIPSFGPHLSVNPAQLQKIAVIAPGLAQEISESYYSEVPLKVSGTLLCLLVKLVKNEDTQATIKKLEKREREILTREARKLSCHEIVEMLEGIPKSPSGSCLTADESTTRSKKTNDNGGVDHTQTVKKRSKSLRRMSIFVKEKKETVVENVEVSVTEDLITSDATPLDILLSFAATQKNNSLLCHYYPMVATDEELILFLKNPLGDTRHYNFAQALGECFATQGFPNGVPSTTVLDMLRPILSGTILGEQFETHLQLARTHSLSHIEVTIEDLDSIFDDYSHAEIAAAWTQSNVNLFRNLKPADLQYIDSENPVNSSFSLLSGSFDNTIVWLKNLLGKQNAEKKLALLERLVKIAHSMLKVGDYHGAFTIHVAFLKSNAYDSLKYSHKKKELMETFLFEHEYECCREKLAKLRDSDNSRFLSAALFYSIEFNKKRKPQAENPSKRIIELGTFLQQVHKDKSRAPKVENVNAELLNLFMNLAYLKVKT